MGVGVRDERTPVLFGLYPIVARGRQGAVAHVVDRFVVHGDKTTSRARFDCHVAERHAAFHREVADRGARKFDGAARAARGADFSDDGKGNILAGEAGGEFAFDLHEHVAVLFREKRLGGENVFDFGRADPERQRRAGTVGGGVAVAADDGHAGQRRPFFRPHHVNDALALVHEGKVGGAPAGADVLVKRFHLKTCDGIRDAVHALFPTGRGGVVVGGGDDGGNAPGFALCQPQTFKSLRTRHFVHQVAVDVEGGRAVVFDVDDVLVPKFVVKGLCHGDFGRFVVSLGNDGGTRRRGFRAGGISAYKRRVFSRFLWEGSNSA